MKKLGIKAFEQAAIAIRECGRSLEIYKFDRYFHNGNCESILEELKKYQNGDGGFGHGLEPDFRMPFSSPKATAIGIMQLSEINHLEEAQQRIKAAINYLESVYQMERKGWCIASTEINNFPHAPWWHCNSEGKTVLDMDWGNPSAQITACLYKYRNYVKHLDVYELVENAIARIESKNDFLNRDKYFVPTLNMEYAPEHIKAYFRSEKLFDSRGEIACYIKLHNVLPQKFQERLEKRIRVAVSQIIEHDESKWNSFVPTPLDFVAGPDKSHFGVSEQEIDGNLDFLVSLFEKHGRIIPSWTLKRDYYDDKGLMPAYAEWIGVLTLNALLTLKIYNRLN